MILNKDFKEFLELLNENKVRYLVIGGFAFAYYAEPRYTKDIDIWVDTTEENIGRLLETIKEFWQSDPGITAEDFRAEDFIIQLGNEPIRIDLINSIENVEFAKAWEKRVIGEYGNIQINFIALDDLIKNKESTGRERDLLDAAYLKKVKKRKM